MPSIPIQGYVPETAREELYRRFSRRGLWRQRLRRLLQGWAWLLSAGALSCAKRALDLLAALALLLLLSPALAFAFLTPGGTLRWGLRVGRWCRTFYEYSLALPDNGVGRLLARLRIHRLPVLFNILKGDMSFVGPRATSPGDLSPRERAARRRYEVRPGLVCLWWVRRRANIAYEGEAETDGEYVETRSVRGDLGIALRAIPAALYGEGGAAAPGRITLLGVPIDNLTMSEAVEAIVRRLEEAGPFQVCFVNADCVNIACRDPDYLRVLRGAGLTLADGIGLKLAGKLLGLDIRQNVNGTDLFPRLCGALSGTGRGVFLLGGRPGVAEGVRGWLAEHYPGVTVSGVHHGYFPPEEEGEVVRRIARSGAAVLLVALGAPRQDRWIHQHLERTEVRVGIGVGGLFDFYSGRIPRAPLWMREVGLEWFYRFCQEPGRMWKRYFVGNAVFLSRVLVER
jgi:N-acetylglucosaminyldiphosphoundecaprenol N-acetyl-beta-D-mannosaminyltransferase